MAYNETHQFYFPGASWLAFNEQGLIPIITQNAIAKTKLKFAWMDKEAHEKTLVTKRMIYWLRSVQKLRVKSKTSG